jgi:hypothetical protein
MSVAFEFPKPKPEDEPTFHCRECSDEPNGWIVTACPGRGKHYKPELCRPASLAHRAVCSSAGARAAHVCRPMRLCRYQPGNQAPSGPHERAPQQTRDGAKRIGIPVPQTDAYSTGIQPYNAPMAAITRRCTGLKPARAVITRFRPYGCPSRDAAPRRSTIDARNSRATAGATKRVISQDWRVTLWPFLTRSQPKSVKGLPSVQPTQPSRRGFFAAVAGAYAAILAPWRSAFDAQDAQFSRLTFEGSPRRKTLWYGDGSGPFTRLDSECVDL